MLVFEVLFPLASTRPIDGLLDQMHAFESSLGKRCGCVPRKSSVTGESSSKKDRVDQSESIGPLIFRFLFEAISKGLTQTPKIPGF
jgi:hypothetical protein